MKADEGGTPPGWLGRIERLGNALPDPTVLFALGAALVFLFSWIAARAGWECVFDDGAGTVLRANAKNLLSAEGLRWLALNLVPIFVGFKPLGLVLAVSIGVAVAERSGLFATALRSALVYVPRDLLTPATFLVGILSTLAADAGFIVLPPLAGAVFASVGRPPRVGIAAVTAGVCMGFGSNLFLTTQDPMLSGLTEKAAQLLDPSYTVDPACNWYIKAAATVVLVLVGWLVTARFVEPRCVAAALAGAGADAPAVAIETPTARERRALLRALGAGLAVLVLFVVCERAPWGFLHDAPPAPGQPEATPTWISSIVALLVLLFLVPGLVYGIVAGSIRSSRDVTRMMSEYMGVLASYVVMAFFAAILVEAFARSNLGTMLAIAGGNELRELALPHWALLLALIAISSALDLVVVSMSAKWAMLATIAVPMFMTLGISPELTQAAYRIGDSVTNPISPLNMYLFIVLTFLRRFEPRAGFGTLVALLLPYAVAFAVAWIGLLFLWLACGWPLGPDGPLVYPPNP